MYIDYFMRGGIEYARATRSVREGAKVTKADQVYLGRVVDRDLGLFRNRKWGLFAYDVETGEVLPPPAGYEERPLVRENARGDEHPEQGLRSVSFGDMFVVTSLLRTYGLMACLEAVAEGDPALEADTACALACFSVLDSRFGLPVEDWWDYTCAHLLFPKAHIAEDEMDEVLAHLGSVDARRRFSEAYRQFAVREGDADKALDTVLTDDADLFERTGQAVEPQTGDLLRGRLLLAHVSALVWGKMIDALEAAGVSLTPKEALFRLHEHHAFVGEGELRVQEPPESVAEVYEALGVDWPHTVRIEATD